MYDFDIGRMWFKQKDSVAKADKTEATVAESEPIGTDGVDNTEKVEQLVEASAEVKVEEQNVDSPWKVLGDYTYEFAVNDSAFRSESFGLTVGYAGEIHYSEDSGANWPKAENKSMCRFGLDFPDEYTIYTCGNGGDVTKSTDGGKTFTKMTDYKEAKSTMIRFCDADNGIIVTQMSDMAITADGAQTWTDIVKPKSTVIAISMKSANAFSYISDDFNLYKTTDGGATWSTTPMNLPEQSDYRNLQKNFAYYCDGNGTYTIFCFVKSTELMKCYTTTDFVCYTEVAMPSLDIKPNYLYVNHEGDVVTLYKVNDKRAVVLGMK